MYTRRAILFGITSSLFFPRISSAEDDTKRYVSAERDLEIELSKSGNILTVNTTMRPNAWPFIVGEIEVKTTSEIDDMYNTITYSHTLKQDIDTSLFIGDKISELQLILDSKSQKYKSREFERIAKRLDERVFSLNDCPCEIDGSFVRTPDNTPLLVNPASFYWVVPEFLPQFYRAQKQMFFTDGKRLYVSKINVDKIGSDSYEVLTKSYKVGSELKRFDRFDGKIKVKGRTITEITKLQKGHSRTAKLIQ